MGDTSPRSDPPADRFAGLYRLWVDRGKREFPDWKPQGEIGVRHRIAEALNHPECQGMSNAQIAHALDMQIITAVAHRDADHPDPMRWYREAWNGPRLATFEAIPDAVAARARVTGGSGPPSKPTRKGPADRPVHVPPCRDVTHDETNHEHIALTATGLAKLLETTP